MQAGFHAADITPPLGVNLAGHFITRPANEVHDPLNAIAVVLDDGTSRVALVATDLVGVNADLVGEARELISAQTGIPPQAVMIWGTHTHAGPVLGSREWHAQDNETRELLPRQIAGCVAAAAGRMQPVTLRFGRGHEDRIAFNRRYRMRDGSVATNPGVGNPAVAAVDGPIDPEVGVLFFDAEDGPLGAIVNHGCHLDVLGNSNFQYSADFPWAMREALKTAYGPQFTAVFANGPCGNINHINVFAKERQGGFDHCRVMGRTLAGEVMKVDYSAEPIACEPLWYRSETVPLKLRRFTEEEIAEFHRILEDPDLQAKQVSSGNFERGRAERALAIVKAGITTSDAEVQVIGLGDVALVAIPGEYFVEFGLQIKAASEAAVTLVIELANGSIGYIPTAEALAEGGYEGSSAKFSPDAGQMLADAALEMIRSGDG